MLNKNLFEKQYKKQRDYGELKLNREVVKILKYKKSGTVLDLGVGKGKNALFLAKKGFDVTGIDISREKVNNFLKFAKDINVKVKALMEDINKIKFDKTYDVIISNSTLHFLKKEEIKRIIKNMKEYTKQGGINLISVFTVENPSKNFPYLFGKNELKESYKDWKILEYEEYLSSFEKHGKDGRLHQHGIAAIIARK